MKGNKIISALLLFGLIAAWAPFSLADPETPAETDSSLPVVTPLITNPPPTDAPTTSPTDSPVNTPTPVIITPAPPPAPTQTPITPTPTTPTPTAPTPTPVVSDTAVPSISPTPEGGYRVVITAQDTNVLVNDLTFDLHSIPTAVDETGEALPVAVLDRGGFLISVPGVYTVVFEAAHPVTSELFHASCVVTVTEEIETQKSTLKGTSDSRYKKYLQYRNEVSAILEKQMTKLNLQFEERLALLRSAFIEANRYELLRQVYTETETDEAVDPDYAAPVTLQNLPSPKISNWTQVIAVYVAKSASLTVDDPLDLFNLRKISFDEIDQVFWDMHDLRFDYADGVFKVILTERDTGEMADLYRFSEERRAQLDELMQPEFQRLFAALTGDENFSDLSAQEEEAIRAKLPAGLNMQQENVVLTAYTLVGQVRYFWGGKYTELGWNALWGVPKVVTSPDSPTTGTVRPFGLDCSGFVSWAFINAAKDPAVLEAIGSGSANQWHNSRSVGWDEAQPGDLAFKASPGSTPTNHVGIVVERQADGTVYVVHCSSSKNNVVVTEAWSSSFRYIRRPVLYDAKS